MKIIMRNDLDKFFMLLFCHLMKENDKIVAFKYT